MILIIILYIFSFLSYFFIFNFFFISILQFYYILIFVLTHIFFYAALQTHCLYSNTTYMYSHMYNIYVFSSLTLLFCNNRNLFNEGTASINEYNIYKNGPPRCLRDRDRDKDKVCERICGTLVAFSVFELKAIKFIFNQRSYN